MSTTLVPTMKQLERAGNDAGKLLDAAARKITQVEMCMIPDEPDYETYTRNLRNIKRQWRRLEKRWKEYQQTCNQ